MWQRSIFFGRFIKTQIKIIATSPVFENSGKLQKELADALHSDQLAAINPGG